MSDLSILDRIRWEVPFPRLSDEQKNATGITSKIRRTIRGVFEPWIPQSTKNRYSEELTVLQKAQEENDSDIASIREEILCADVPVKRMEVLMALLDSKLAGRAALHIKIRIQKHLLEQSTVASISSRAIRAIGIDTHEKAETLLQADDLYSDITYQKGSMWLKIVNKPDMPREEKRGILNEYELRTFNREIAIRLLNALKQGTYTIFKTGRVHPSEEALQKNIKS